MNLELLAYVSLVSGFGFLCMVPVILGLDAVDAAPRLTGILQAVAGFCVVTFCGALLAIVSAL